MDNLDWKERLAAAMGMSPEEAQAAQAPVAEEANDEPKDAVTLQGKQMLDIVLDRKGRHGKQATIVAGWVADDRALKEVASELRHTCGTGGSARGGEILLQGDCREKVRAALVAMGLKARII